MTSVATPSESNDDALDVDAIDIDALLDVADAVDVTWVREQHQLAEVINALATCGRVALDTEFIKRDTYYPRLALVQLNTGNHVYLLDAPELQLSELWEALRQVDVAIWHACGEDLGIFYLLSGCPPLTNIFDTQIANSFLDGEYTIGYQGLVEQELGIVLDKHETRSNWIRRPLSDSQLKYAALDVEYLIHLYKFQKEELSRSNKMIWLEQDIQRLLRLTFNPSKSVLSRSRTIIFGAMTRKFFERSESSSYFLSFEP